ncbi:uncharacterized protein LOC124272766 [Haliotis rubra]|uniref:uncharacterized protein LOC124272766 n=1 Tax=Haliotis rubra TaxID=36100 RepID=UPI001EE5E428|nr:uncharacterized protein LOC124272766 [Haliotis rubra]
MSDSDSSVTSSYSSDGPYFMSYGKTYDGTSVSNEPDGSAMISDYVFPSSVLSRAEQNEMLRILREESKQPSVWIFPRSVCKYLSAEFSQITERLEELLQQDCAVIIAGRTLLNLTEGSWQERVPESVICNVCVFSPAHPVMILTFSTPSSRPETAAGYNSCLARSIIRAVIDETQVNFNVFRGVIDENVCQTRETFLERIQHLKSISQVLGSLSNPTQDMVTLLEPFLKLLHASQLQQQSDRESQEQGTVTETTRMQEASHPGLDTAADEKRIVSALSGLPATDKSPNLEAATTGANDNGHAPIQRREFTERILIFQYDVLLKRIEQLEQKQEDILQEKEKLHQDHLTDVRLSLLMRPRSSSISQSDSGFSTSTSTGDRSEKADVRIEDKHLCYKNEADTRPQLPNTEKDGGDLELIKTNREATLHEACQGGRLDAVTHIVTRGLADINCRGRLGRTPLMVAARGGYLSIVNFLIRHDCEISEVDDYNDTVLHVACMSRNVDVVKRILSQNTVNMEKKGRYAWTPVMRAANKGHRELFDLLVSKGCDLSVVDGNRNNILHVACLGGNVDICKYLLSNDIVGIESRGQYNMTPVMIAASKGHRELFDFLVSKGCDLSVVDGNRNNILHVACLGGNVDFCKYLLSNDIVGIKRRGQYNMTPVMKAASKGHRELFDFLVSKGCDLSVVDGNRDNILHVACLGGNVDICKYLLSNDIVGIESRGQYNMTPVMVAANTGHRELFDFLVSKGCDLSVVDGNRDNILHMACLGGNVDICKYLLSNDIVGIESRGQYNRTPVMKAASEGHRELFDFLVSKGCDLSVVDGNRDNILHMACLGGNVDICKYLLSKNIVGIESRGQYNRTTVMIAASMGHRDLFDFLVNKGCDLSVVDGDGNNIVHVACLGGNVDICKYLLSNDIVGIESRGQYKRTPVMKAASKGHRELFDFLLNKGCDLSVVDGDGNNILHVACLGGNVDICKYLLSNDIVGIESRGQYNWTPVMLAANKGHRELFDFLVSKGCDLSVVDGNRDNILHLACLGGNVDICKYLLSNDIVGIESRGQYNWTPGMLAANKGHRDLLDFLVSKGCDLSVVDVNRDNILHLACVGGNVDICKYLLSNDIVGIESRGQYNWTPVMLAANKGHRELFDFLVSKGCDLSVVDGNRDNILHLACLGGNVDICKYLLSNDIVGIESRGQYNWTPGMLAANQGHRDLLDFLVSKGCDLSVVDVNRDNILHLACVGGNVDICKYLLSNDILGIESRGQYNRTPVMKAASNGHRELFDFLVSKGCDLSVVDVNRDSILHLACLGGNVDICKYLLSNDILGIESRGQYNRTPVMKAANKGHRELFDFLVSKGCDLSVVDGNRNNILHVACVGGNVDICKYLLSKDIAGIESRGQYNMTPVMIAASMGHRELFDFLVSKGCDLSVVDVNRNNILHRACLGGNVDICKYLLSNDIVGIESRGQYNRTPLMVAASNGHRELFDFLVSKGCHLSVVDGDGDNILHVACFGGNVDICKYLLSKDIVGIESRGQYNRTPLMIAASKGHREMFDFLVSKGCDLSVVDGNRNNILHVACVGGNVDICKYLLSKDIVGIESRGQYNMTPVMMAANNGHRELFDFLVSKGCDLSVVDGNRNNILHVACVGGNVDICKYLLSKDIVGIESRGQYNMTPVMMAANNGHRELFDFLVSKGCDLSVVDGDGDTILYVACVGGNVDICKYLLSNDIVGIESRGEYNRTPVMVAASNGHRELFDFLVSKGCDLSVVDGDGDNILHVACLGGNVDICKYLLSNDIVGIESRGQYNWTPVMVAASNGHRELFDFLVSKGCDLSVVDGDGDNIVHVACFGGNVDICKYLLSNDIAGIESRGQYNRTPLMIAANKGHREMFDLLVSKGCDLSVVDGNRSNILHVACVGGNVDICKYLLSNDIAGIESRGQYNRTPLMIAANKGHREMFDFLVSKGCDLSVVDGNRSNILHVACLGGNVDICRYLLSNDIVGIESRGQYNRTPLMVAASNGHRELFDFLVSKGCHLSVVDGDGDNILHVACLGGNVDICKYLLSNDIVGIESRGEYNRTPVMVAASNGHRELFDFLVSKGCDLSVVDGDGDNILHVACLGGNVDICKYLLSNDIVRIESRGQYNWTPVMVAANQGHRELFDFLVSKGCDLSVVDGDGDNILHRACLGGNVDICKYLLSNDIVRIESRGQYNWTPVMVAANQGHREMFDFLVSKGCDLSVVDGNRSNILHVACFGGNVDICKYLLSKDIVGIESRGQYNRTPLMIAASKGHREMFDFLVSKGCDLSVVDGNRNNILHVACVGGNVDICKYLLSKDIVGIESRGQYNMTPVMMAANNGHRELFDFLVSKGCDLSVVDGNRNNILHVACVGGNVDICKYLLSKDIVGIESRGQYNMTPVMMAANNGHRELFDFLVSKGCDLSVVDGDGDNILHVACVGGNVDIFRYLLSNDIVRIESRGQYNWTPVMVAASKGHRELFDFLVSKGCDLSVVDGDGDTILYVACVGGNVDICKYLLSNDIVGIESRGQYNWTPVMVAASKGHRELFDFLVSKGCDLSVVDGNRDNFVHVACFGGNVDICKYLLSNDIVGIESRGQYNWTPVMVAASNGHRELFDFLVSKGCDLSVVDGDGNNILHVACFGGNVDICKYLLSNDIVGIESRGQYNRTPLMIAANKGHRELFDFLVSKGCDLSVVVGDGTPFFI